MHKLRRKEIIAINGRNQTHYTQKGIDLLERRQFNQDSMATNHFPMEEFRYTLDLEVNYRDGVMNTMTTAVLWVS